MPARQGLRGLPQEDVVLLQRQPLFSGLDKAQLEHLISYAKASSVASGTTILALNSGSSEIRNWIALAGAIEA